MVALLILVLFVFTLTAVNIKGYGLMSNSGTRDIAVRGQRCNPYVTGRRPLSHGLNSSSSFELIP